MNLKPTKEIAVKTLFIAATRDAALPPTPENLAAMHKYVVEVEVKHIDAGHFIHLEKDKEVNDTIEEWLSKQA